MRGGTGSAHALTLERQVVERIREIGRDPELIAEVARQAWVQVEERRVAMRKERRLNGRPAMRAPRIHEDEVARALAQFDGVWDALLPRERARVFGLLVGRVDYGPDKQSAIRFRAA